MFFMTPKPEAPVLTERERTFDLLGMTRLREVEKTRGRIALALTSHRELDDSVDTPWQYSLTMWSRFLPMRRQLREYVLDAPPSDVLNELEQAALFKIYDTIEIWTPEQKSASTDRMVVGVIAEDADTKRYFRIAHWGSPHTSPDDVRATLQQLDLDAERAARAARRLKRWEKHRAKVFFGSAVTVFGLVIVTLVIAPGLTAQPETPSTPYIEVVEEGSEASDLEQEPSVLEPKSPLNDPGPQQNNPPQPPPVYEPPSVPDQQDPVPPPVEEGIPQEPATSHEQPPGMSPNTSSGNSDPSVPVEIPSAPSGRTGDTEPSSIDDFSEFSMDEFAGGFIELAFRIMVTLVVFMTFIFVTMWMIKFARKLRRGY